MGDETVSVDLFPARPFDTVDPAVQAHQAKRAVARVALSAAAAAKTRWIPGAKVVDLSGSKGYGPFGSHGPFLGVCLHVNVDENGTSDAFWRNNPADVCPNFQVYKGPLLGNAGGYGVHQMLPLDWQPWCQQAGNYQYAAIETAGLVSQPLTDYQVGAIADILTYYHDEMGMPYQLANAPGQRGLITHAAGGAAWGGHPCPGTIRTAQRPAILEEADMPTVDEIADEVERRAKAQQSQLWTNPYGTMDDDLYGPGGHAPATYFRRNVNAIFKRLDAIDEALAALKPGGTP
jgi:hypothetical protein